jgi:hypothetical protein
MSPPLRILLIMNAVATLAAGLVLFIFPGAIPATIGVAPPADANIMAWLLGASELGLCVLCVVVLRRPDPAALRLAVITLIAVHAASALADLLALPQHAGPALIGNVAVRLLMVALLAVFGLRPLR